VNTKSIPILLGYFALFLMSCCQSQETIVTISKADGETLMVKVEIADTPEERAQGLMYRENLPQGEGMLFLFPEETRSSFWMKDTPISLDMIFINNDQIVDLIENAVPFSETLLTPRYSYNKVLEVPAGYVQQNGIEQGNGIKSP